MKKEALLALIGLSLAFPLFSSAQSVDLFWQGTGYSMPFYKGRVSWTKLGDVLFMAVPQNLGNSTSLNYRWSKDGTVLGSLSGAGKNTLRLSDSAFSRSTAVMVEIMDGEGNTLASNSATLTPTDGRVLIYENNPLYGYLFHHEAGEGYRMDGKEVAFAAFPLGFNSGRFSSDLAYRWTSPAAQPQTGPFVSYSAPESATGQALINLRVTSEKYFTQSGERKFTLLFGNE